MMDYKAFMKLDRVTLTLTERKGYYWIENEHKTMAIRFTTEADRDEWIMGYFPATGRLPKLVRE